MAIDLLGHYLATAPDDGRAWLQLGRFYLFDARDWHLARPPGRPRRPALPRFRRHRARPGGPAVGRFGRGLPRRRRGGPRAGSCSRTPAGTPRWRPGRGPMPRRCRAYIVELGANLLTSCPVGRRAPHRQRPRERSRSGTAASQRAPLDILPIRPDLYATDSALPPPHGRGHGRGPRAAGAARPGRGGRRAGRLCLSPTTDCAAAPALAWMPFRLVRVSRPPGPTHRTRSASPSCSRRRARPGRPGSRTSQVSTTAPPATTPSSAAVCSSSSGTRRRMQR